MHKLIPFGGISLLLIFSSCNRFIDQQPTPDQGPPAESVQAITRWYPQAQDILLTTLVNNQLWQASFTQQRYRYQALVGSGRLLTADQVVESDLPDSLTRLVKPTVVAGGTFSQPRFRQWQFGWSGLRDLSGPLEYLFATYVWQQQRYTAQWSVARPTTGKAYYNFELSPFWPVEYQTDNLTDISESIQTVLQEQSLTFTYAVIQMDAAGQRRYALSVNRQGQYWNLTYNNEGQLLAANNPQTAQLIQQVDQLPASVQAYLQRPELVGFALNRGSAMYGYTAHHTYGSLGTYRVSLINGNQGWLLLFSDSGQLISQSFLAVGYY